MPSASIAEWVLALVTTPEKASAITGDLVEDSLHRGVPRFWWNLARTFCALIGRDLAANRGRMASLACRALLLQFAWIAIGVLTLFGVILVIGIALAFIGFLFGIRILPLPKNTLWDWTEAAAGGFIFLFAEYKTGRWIARRSPGHEGAALCAFCLAQIVAGIPFDIGMAVYARETPHYPWIVRDVFYQIPCALLSLLPTLGGVLRERRPAFK